MSRVTAQIIRCEGRTGWRRIDGADLCPACWDAMQTIEDWRTNR